MPIPTLERQYISTHPEEERIKITEGMQPRISLIGFGGRGDRGKLQIFGKWNWVWWVWQGEGWRRLKEVIGWREKEGKREKIVWERSIAISGRWENWEREIFLEKMENWEKEKERNSNLKKYCSEKWEMAKRRRKCSSLWALRRLKYGIRNHVRLSRAGFAFYLYKLQKEEILLFKKKKKKEEILQFIQKKKRE